MQVAAYSWALKCTKHLTKRLRLALEFQVCKYVVTVFHDCLGRANEFAKGVLVDCESLKYRRRFLQPRDEKATVISDRP